MINEKVKKLAIVSILLHGFLISAHYTDADIFAERTIRENKISAITLDFKAISSLDYGSIITLFNSYGIIPGGYDIKTIRIKGEANRKFNYHLKTYKVNGDDFFCDNVKLSVYDKKFSEKFNGNIMDLSFDSSIDSELDNLIFFISLEEDGDEFKNKICEFNFNFKTYRDDVDENKGIIAERLVRNVVSSGNW